MASTHATVEMVCAAKRAGEILNYVLTSFNRNLRTTTDSGPGTQTDNVKPKGNMIANFLVQGRSRLGIRTFESQSVCERNSGKLIGKVVHYH